MKSGEIRKSERSCKDRENFRKQRKSSIQPLNKAYGIVKRLRMDKHSVGIKKNFLAAQALPEAGGGEGAMGLGVDISEHIAIYFQKKTRV